MRLVSGDNGEGRDPQRDVVYPPETFGVVRGMLSGTPVKKRDLSALSPAQSRVAKDAVDALGEIVYRATPGIRSRFKQRFDNRLRHFVAE